MRTLGALLILVFATSVHAQDPRALQVTCEAYSIYQDTLGYSDVSPEELCRSFGRRNCDSVTHLGQALCRIFGGTSCILVDSIGEGICRAAGGSSCGVADSIDEGICRALGGSECSVVENMGEGICRGLRGRQCGFITSPSAIQAWLIRFQSECRQAQ